jgi:hypothetical protein
MRLWIHFGPSRTLWASILGNSLNPCVCERARDQKKVLDRNEEERTYMHTYVCIHTHIIYVSMYNLGREEGFFVIN